eukprot:Hpha_TRINITY_DN16445_c3_g1::TRINITY_DN16445_c3_g1_i2::g.159034::m.159034
MATNRQPLLHPTFPRYRGRPPREGLCGWGWAGGCRGGLGAKSECRSGEALLPVEAAAVHRRAAVAAAVEADDALVTLLLIGCAAQRRSHGATPSGCTAQQQWAAVAMAPDGMLGDLHDFCGAKAAAKLYGELCTHSSASVAEAALASMLTALRVRRQRGDGGSTERKFDRFCRELRSRLVKLRRGGLLPFRLDTLIDRLATVGPAPAPSSSPRLRALKRK